MTEIGSEQTFASGARRVASAFGNLALLLVLIWLVRGFILLSGYSFQILFAAFAFVYLHGLFGAKTGMGVARATSSLFSNLTGDSIIILIVIYFLGWVAGIQQDVLPVTITQQVPNLVIAAIVTALAAIAASRLAPRIGGPVMQGPSILVKPSSGLDFGKVKVSTKKDAILLPLRNRGRTIGAVVFGDLMATFETPMGKVTATVPGPVTTMGIPFRGSTVGNEEVSRLTGSNKSQLVSETQPDTSLPRGEIFERGFEGSYEEQRMDLPFVRVRRNSEGDSVDVGPISVRRGHDDDVEVGPFSFNPCDWNERGGKKDEGSWWRRNFGSSWLAKGNRGLSYFSASGDGAQARWNGSSLRLRGDSMKMAVGGDGFVYTPSELETYSPLHSLRVTQGKTSLNTKKFTVDISGAKVTLRAEGGSKKTESPPLANDLQGLLAEIAHRQVKDVMDGEPMELDEMMLRTEEVLRKYQ